MDTDAASDALSTVAISMWFSAPSGARSHKPIEHQMTRMTTENETCHDARARISAKVTTGWRSRRKRGHVQNDGGHGDGEPPCHARVPIDPVGAGFLHGECGGCDHQPAIAGCAACELQFRERQPGVAFVRPHGAHDFGRHGRNRLSHGADGG